MALNLIVETKNNRLRDLQEILESLEIPPLENSAKYTVVLSGKSDRQSTFSDMHLAHFALLYLGETGAIGRIEKTTETETYLPGNLPRDLESLIPEAAEYSFDYVVKRGIHQLAEKTYPAGNIGLIAQHMNLVRRISGREPSQPLVNTVYAAIAGLTSYTDITESVAKLSHTGDLAPSQHVADDIYRKISVFEINTAAGRINTAMRFLKVPPSSQLLESLPVVGRRVVKGGHLIAGIDMRKSGAIALLVSQEPQVYVSELVRLNENIRTHYLKENALDLLAYVHVGERLNHSLIPEEVLIEIPRVIIETIPHAPWNRRDSLSQMVLKFWGYASMADPEGLNVAMDQTAQTIYDQTKLSANNFRRAAIADRAELLVEAARQFGLELSPGAKANLNKVSRLYDA